jgi:hypothetical protein
MCKGISVVLTQDKVYWSKKSNSHEVVKKNYNLKDTKIDTLAIAELYPRGKSILSTKHKDWEINFENQPNWLTEDVEKYKDRSRCGRDGLWAGNCSCQLKWELVKEGAMDKYTELKQRIEALKNGWDKEADDILDVIQLMDLALVVRGIN